ncbi:PilZ domain-containing protein [Methylovulum psychrotolerans]|jgi:hypothetical protein|uniref:PilZ domain-containing protein n=1 Tax=Methylovulum psychrotolerans TaxID=1704499 RepID=A0A1Z4BUM1_9GAMM|nr:PilZ domain-containing protein [Methylovulum psychrotolerans]ASF44958.1 hypothetical protein CEK71_02130 [Methylovulum psychrotolerans]MBT9098238.1 PilZ domain-containing protein [Methylovulum psychrotolerans]POZ53949.1 PilZ domain-containing protein [Methylovulum psychrotolerans]
MKKIIKTPQPDRRKRIDRRIHSRVLTEIAFAMTINGQEYIGNIDNISLSGAFLSNLQPYLAPELISQSGTINIEFDGEQLKLVCEIVYIAPMDNEFFPIGAGVMFNGTDAKTQASINKLASMLALALEEGRDT